MKIREKFKALSKKEKRICIIKYGCLIMFILCSLVLIIESLMPGKVSSDHSNKVGDLVDLPTNKTVNPTAISLTGVDGKLPSDVYVGESVTLIAVFSPQNTTYKQIEWSLSDKSKAHIQGDNLTFDSSGKVTVTATSEYNKSITASYTFTIHDIPVESITIDNIFDEPLIVGHSVDLFVTVLPANATNKSYTFSSDSDAIVIEDGKLIAVKTGSATITVTAAADKNITYSVNVTVIAIELESIEFHHDGQTIQEISLYQGQSTTISFRVYPEDATNQELEWDNEDGVSITSYGTRSITVKALTVGTSTISVKPKDNEDVFATLTVVVKAIEVTDINYTVTVAGKAATDDPILANIGDSIKIATSILPTEAAYKQITYTVSPSTGLSVNAANGNVTASKEGSYTVTLKCDNVEKEINFKIEPVNVTKVDITYNSKVVTDDTVHIKNKQQIALSAKFQTDPLGKSASNSTVNWTSDNETCVKIISKTGGTIQGISPGTAKITCTHTLTGLTATVTVQVTQEEIEQIDNIMLVMDGEQYDSDHTFELKTGKTYDVSFIALKDGKETTSTLTPKISDNITYASNKLTAVSSGKATITVTGGSISKVFEFNITDIKLTAIEFGFKKDSVYFGDKISVEDLKIILKSDDEDGFPPTATIDDLAFEYDHDELSFVGKVFTINKLGDIQITAKYGDISKSITVTAISNLKDIIANEISMFVGDYSSIEYESATFNDAEAAPFKCTYLIVEGDDFITLSDEGIIKAQKAGNAKIKILIENSDIFALLTITVNDVLIHSINIIAPTETKIGEEYKLVYSLLPENVSARKVIWSSSDNSIATITNSGEVKFLMAGTVTITARAEQGGQQASIQLTAYNVLNLSEIKATGFESLSSFENKKAFAELKRNSSVRLSVVYGKSATYKEVSIVSSDENILTVKDNTVTALNTGVATVTLTYWDGDDNLEPVIYTIEVTVVKQRFSDTMSNWSKTIRKGLGHFGAFFITGIFAALTYLLFIKRKYLSAIFTLISGFGLAGFTEFLQLITPNRGPSFPDVMLDFEGFCCSAIPIIIGFVIFALVKYIKSKKNNNDKNS